MQFQVKLNTQEMLFVTCFRHSYPTLYPSYEMQIFWIFKMPFFPNILQLYLGDKMGFILEVSAIALKKRQANPTPFGLWKKFPIIHFLTTFFIPPALVPCGPPFNLANTWCLVEQ